MRILFVCNEYPPSPHGGIGVFVQTLARLLAAEGHAVWVIGFDAGVAEDLRQDDRGVQVLRLAQPAHRLPALRLGRYALHPGIILDRRYLSQRVRALFVEQEIDLIESFDWAGPLWFAPGQPLVVRLHGANAAHAYDEGKPPSRLLKFLEKRNLLMADRLVAVSDHMRRTTLAAYGIDREVEVIWSGVDSTRFSPVAGASEANSVLYVGRIHERKGIRELLAAWALVAERIPAARLYLVGSGTPAYVEALLADVTPGVRESVQFVGAVPHDQLPAWYNRAQVAVFPSRAEAFGLTCIEAMSCGGAVVMTSRASGPELVEDRVSGLLVEPSDGEALATAICTLLQDASLRQRLGAAARQRVVKQFDLQRIVQQNVAFYRQVLEATRQHE